MLLPNNMVRKFYHFIDRKLGVKELVKYGVVGVIGAIIDIGLLNIFVHFTKMDVYNSLVVAFLLSVMVCYFLHSHWTFQVKKKPIKLMVYILSAIVGLIINFTVMYLLIEGWDLWFNYAKIIAILIALMWNYTISKTLVFNVFNR